MSCFRRRATPSRAGPRRRRRRPVVQRPDFKPSFAPLEPRVLLTHNVGSLDDTYLYTAPVTADVLEIDVTTEGYGRITAKAGGSTLQTDTFTKYKAVEIDASGGVAADTVKLLGSLATVATNGLQTLTIKAGAGTDTIDFSALAAADQFVKVTVDAGDGADTFKAPNGTNTFDVTGTGTGAVESIAFSGVENLVAGTGDDEFFLGPTAAIAIDGGGGSGIDTLFGPDVAAGVNWRITGAGAGDATAVGSGSPAITFTALENVVGGQYADTFAIGAAGSLAGTLDGGVVIDDTKIDALDLSARTAAVTVSLADGTVKEGGTTLAKFQRIRSFTGGGSAGDVLVGPDVAGTAVAWIVNGANGGTVRGVPFAGFENLTGGDTSADTFTFERGSSLSGMVTGGSGTGDAVFVATASGGLDYTVLDPTASPSPATLNGITIRHAGIDPVTVLSGDGTNQTLDGTAGADVITISPGATAGQTKVEFQRRFLVSGNWSTGSVWKTETFANPTRSLTVRGRAGEDVIVVKGLGSGFSAGLNLYGYEANGSADASRREDDEVRFEANTLTGGGAIDVFADRIVVTAGTKVSSLVADGTSFASAAVRGENWSAWRATVGGQITFRARESGTPELDNLIPWPYFTRDVGIDIGAAAEIRGGRIEMTAEAEEIKLKDRLKTGGLARELVSFAADALKSFVDLPLKVLVKKATSTVTVGAGAKLLAASDVRIVALASADSTASAASEIVSIGVSWAESAAIVSVGTNATIKAGGTLDVFADGTAIAAMASETARDEPNPALGALEKFSGSVAVADARLTAHATVAAGATVYGGRTVNVRAFGVIESEAEADAQMMADGTAAVGAAIQLSRADILTKIGGTVVGDLATAGGDATNLEFDPLRPAADYDSNAPGNVIVHRAQDGWIASTVRLASAVPTRAGVVSDQAMPAGTILRYVGSVDADGKKTIALADQDFRDTTTWQVSSEPIGFVDFDNDRIAIFDSGAGSGRVYNNFTGLTGDPVEYSPRRGAHIGGLNPGEYFIIRQTDDPATVVDESRYIKLARSRQLARDGVAINLTNRAVGVQVSTNIREFSATDVQGDSIYFPGIGNTFMIGQPVLYREQGRGSNDRVIEKTGGAVVWQSTDPVLDGTPYVPTIAGLRHGTVYYVKTAIDEFNLDGDQRLVSGQRIQLANLENDAVAGLAIQLGTVDTSGATARPAISAVDAAADTLALVGHGLSSDTLVTYSPGTATSIGGLEASRQYRVVRVDADTVAVGAGFTGANVDVDTDTITFAAPHFLKNGDAVSYRATTPVGGLASGTIYYVRVIDETTIKLAATKAAALYPNQSRVQFDQDRLDGTTFRVVNAFTEGQAVTFRTTDAATVAGLSSGRTYYVTNRTATTFQLAEESGGAALTGLVVSGAALGSVFTVGSEGIDFTAAGAAAATHQLRLDLASVAASALAGGRHQLRGQAASDFSLTALHVIDTGQSPVGATASLDATATASAASAASDYQPEEEPDGFLGKVASGKDFLDKYSNAFKIGFDKWSQSYKDNADKGGAKSKSTIQAAGSIAFSFTDHDVQAIVEKTAKMAAPDDLEVIAEISQAIQLQAESATEPQNDADGNPSGTAAKNSVSAAIVVGVENNSARAIVEEGAALDSLRALRVIGKVSYPFLTRPDEFVPTSVAELADRFKDFETAQDTVATYTDGTLGIKSGLVNTWAAATASGEDVGLAGSINVVTFTNVAEAVVKAGAKLNQDSYYRLAGSVPGVTDVSTHESNDGKQTVSVEAYNQMQWLDVTGVFGFPTFEWSLADVSKKRAPQVGAEPGSQGGTGGVGGSVFVHLLDNTTHAVIEEGALVHSGADRGFNLKAEEALFKGSFTQAGASAGTVGVAGSFAYFEQDSDTLAKVAERTKVDGGRVDVYAGSLETQINFVGGITSSKSIGVGAGVAINDTDRRTRAIVGEEGTTRTGTLDAAQAATLDVAGGVVVRANSSGGTFAFAVAGAKANAKADPPAAADPADDTDPLDGVSLPALFEDPQSGESGSPDSANKSRTGVGLAAAVSVIRLTDFTQASVANAKVTADALDVKAIDRNLLVTATGGGALAQTDESKSAVGLAGGFSWNEVSTTTDAVVRDATITLRSDTASTKLVNSPTDKRLSVTADNATRIIAVAAGLAGATSGGGTSPGAGSSTAVSIAGSVALNTVTGATRARLADSTVSFTGTAARSDVRVRATDGSSVITVAGGVSLAIARSNTSGSTSVAAGAAIAVNRLTTTTSATVERVTAGDETHAWADDGTGGFTVLAESTGEIKAFTVAGSGTMASGTSGSGVAGSGAGSGSVNKILVDTTATVRGSTITVPGAAEVRARDTSDILAVAGAVAVSIGQSASGTAAAGGFGASFAVTQIGTAGDENLVAADVDDSTLTAGGPITVAAESAATIFSLAIGAVGSVAGSGSGTAVAGSLAGSISINETRKTTRARAKGSTLRTTGDKSGLSVTATNDSTIDAVAGSAALQGAKSGGGTSVGVGLGFSLTINDIADTALARVEDTLVDVTGAASVKASQTEARIKALSFGVAVSASVSAGGTAVAAGGTGAVALNEIDNTVSASVAGSSAATRKNFTAGGAITVEASSDAEIDATAVAAAASIAVSGGGAAPSVAIGVAVADNRIDGAVAASIGNVPQALTGGAITVEAKNSAEIDANVIAATAAISGSGSTGVGVSGGAAAATNTILTRTTATVDSSTLGTTAAKVGAVTVKAGSDGSIDATVGAVAVAASLGATTGVGAAIGVSVARNFIGQDPRGSVTSTTYRSSQSGVTTLTKGDTVRVVGGGLGGDVYEYVGPTLSDSDPNRDGNQTFDLRIQEYRDTRLWRQANLVEDRAATQAEILDSGVASSGVVTVAADSQGSIDATVFAVSLGVGGGGTTGVGAALSGVYVENVVAADTHAVVEKTAAGSFAIEAASLAVTAADTSAITARGTAAAISAAFGGTAGVAISVGVSLARNTVAGDVEASVDGMTVTTTTGDVNVAASADAAIRSTTAAAAVAAAFGGTAGVALAGAGADATNVVLTKVNALVEDASVTSARDVLITASAQPKTLLTFSSALLTPVGLDGLAGEDPLREAAAATSALRSQFSAAGVGLAAALPGATYGPLAIQSLVPGKAWKLTDGRDVYLLTRNTSGTVDVSRPMIDASVTGAAVSLAGGGTAGVGLAVGAALSRNLVGWTAGGSRSPIEVRAKVVNSAIDATRDLKITATDRLSIDATTFAMAAAVAGGGIGGLGAAGAGSSAVNTIAATVEAAISESAIGREVRAASVALAAADSSIITSWTGATAIAAAFGGTAGVAVSVGVGLAENAIDTSVAAAVDGATVKSTSGGISMTADRTAVIDASAMAAAVAIGGGIAGVGVSGAGARADNSITGGVEARVKNAGVTAAGAVNVAASDSSVIDATVRSLSVAAGGGTVGVGVAVGASVATNTIGSNAAARSLVTAQIVDSAVAATGDLDVTATATRTIDATVRSFAAGIAGGLVGGAGAGAGSSGTNTIYGGVKALIDDAPAGSRTVSARSVDVTAADSSTITATAGAAGIAASFGAVSGSVAIGVGLAKNTIDSQVGASIEDARVTSTSGDVQVSATGAATIDATASAAAVAASGAGLAGLSFSGAGAEANNTILPSVKATVSGGSVTSAADLLVKASLAGTIDAMVDSGSTALAGAGLGAGAIAIGASLATNTIGTSSERAEVRATVSGVAVQAADEVSVSAANTATVDAAVRSFAVGIAGGLVGVSGAGAGSRGTNTIFGDVAATIEDAATSGRTVSASSVAVTASDRSTITATAGAAGIAASFGAVSGSVAIGVGLAKNTIDSQVGASIEDARVTSTGGDVQVSATGAATIDATATAAAVSASGAGLAGLSFSGAGAEANNTIQPSVKATVSGGSVTSAADVTVKASLQGTIDATVDSGATALSGAGLAAGAAAIGASLATNTIGTSGGRADVLATVSGAAVQAADDVSVSATNSATVDATVEAASAALAIGGFLAGAAAGAGSDAHNTIASHVAATVTGGTIAAADVVSITATDTSTITAEALAAAVAGAASFAPIGGSIAVSVGVSIARNTIDSQVAASVAGGAQVTKAALLEVKAGETATITAHSTAASVAAASGALSYAAAGGGAESTNTITTDTRATVTGSTITMPGDVAVTATVVPTATTTVGSVNAAAGLVSLAVGGSVARVTINPVVDASITGSNVTADDIDVRATVAPRGQALAYGVNAGSAAVGVSLSSIDVAPQVTATVGGTIKAATLDVAATSARSASNPTAAARSTGAAGGLLIGIDATRSTVSHGGSVSAGIAAGANLTVTGATTVTAATSARHTATADSVAGGIVAVGVSYARAESSATTAATVGANATITGGSLSISATRDHDQFADNFAGGGGVAAGASATAVTGQTGAVTVTVGDGASVTLGGAFDVDAISTATLNGRVRAVSGGLLAGAGAEVRNGATSDVTAAFGGNARVTARSITVNAGNVLEKPSLGNENIKGGTGGLISGASASSVTTVSFDTKVDVGAASRLTVTGTEATAGEFALRADNRIRAVDTVAFTTGGALSGARAESVVRTSRDNASVTIGDGARLTSVGDVAMAARGGGSVSTATNVETYGVATVAIADSQAEIRPVNLVTIGANARVDAVGNVLVSTGTDTEFNRDSYALKARTDSFAGSAIPIDDVDSDARLISDNRITVSGGAVIESAKDIKLHAERFGFGTMESKAKAVNWASAAASGINSALGGSELYGGDVFVEATGVVTVDGTLRTGSKRIRELVLGTPAPAGGNPGGWDAAAGRVTTIVNPSGLDVTTGSQILQSGLIQELRSAQQNRLVYLGTNATMVAFYDSEIARITTELLGQGLATVQQVYNWTSGSGTRTVLVGDVVRVNTGYGGGGTPGRFYGYKGPRGSIDLGAQNYADTTKWELLADSVVNQVVPVEKYVMTVTVGQSTAQAGIIDIRGDAFVGGGVVEAPRDARITITNHTPAQLVIDGLTIPEQVGGVFLNGDSVLTNAAVNALNLAGLKNATFATLSPATAAEFGAAGPAITLTNTFDGDLWTGVGTYGSPDLVIAGDITNYSGKVALASEGSTVIKGSIRSGSVSIVAGDSVVVQGVSVYGAGGDPYGKLKSLGNGIDKYDTAAAVSLLTAAASTPSVLASTITVDAEYINLNGLIQSGKESYSLTIPASIDAEIAGIRGNGSSSRLTRLSISNTDFKVFYDRIDDKIVVREVRSSGGNVQLTGNLLSTGSGKIKVLDGYASISIDNQTSRDIAIERVDVSQRGAGTLLLADKAKAPGSATYTTGDGSRAVVKDSTTVRLADGYGGGGTPGAVYKFVGTNTTLNLGGEDYRNRDKWVQVPLATLYSRTTPGALTPVDGTYTPAANWRYGFSVGMQTAERTTTTYGTSAWLGIDALAADPDNIREGPTVEILSQPKLLPAGTYFYKSGSADGDYVYDTQVRNMEEPKRFLVAKWDTSTWYGKKTYYEKWTEEKKQETVSTHTFRADRTIDIDFIGASAGSVAITSNAGGRILVNGPILNPSGSTTLTASAGIVQTNSGASVGGRSVVLSAANGAIQDVVTNIDDAAGVGLTATASGAITISEMSGGLPIDAVESTGRGTVALSARTGMTRASGATAAAAVTGGSISLTVTAGGVGAAGAALPIDQGDQGTHVVDVTATGGIHLRETAGNLAARRIHSSNGEVSITVSAGSLVDANRVESRDERTREQLLNTVWGSLQLTAGTGAQAKIDQTLADFAASKQTDYRQYWKWRNTTANPAVYDAGVRIHLTAEENTAYRSYYASQGRTSAEIDAAIETLENSRTQQYRTLHGEFAGYDRGGYAAGRLTASYVTNFTYVLSASEDAALRSGFKIWTEDELLYMVGGGLLKEVTDTQITIEEDNIRGTNVTIVAAGAGGVGSFSAPVTIDLSRRLTQDERVILAAAERADVTFISGSKFTGAVTFAQNAGGDTLTRAAGAWADDGFAAGKYVRIEGRTSNATPDRTVWRIKSVSGPVLTLDRANQVVAEAGRTVTVTPVILDPMAQGAAAPTSIEVAQRDDVDLTTSGMLDVTAAGAAFVGSESDLAIKQFKAGGDATVKTAGKITSAAATAASVVVSGANIVLEASEGGIGTQALPLRIDAGTTGMLTARGKDTVYLTEDAGDMRVETIYSQQGDAVLVTRAGSILDAIGTDLTDVKAASIVLTAGGTGTVGTAADLLDVDQGTEGTLTATGAGVFVHEVAGNMRVSNVAASNGDVVLESQLSIIDADPLPETVGSDVSGDSITLTAILGGVGNAGEELEIDSHRSGSGRVKITAGLLNVYLNELDGDLYLDTIGTGPTATSFVSALTGKIIDDRVDPASFNIISGKVYLFAALDIGAVDKPITTKIANVEGKSTTGSTYIDNTGALVVGGVTGGPKGIESGGEVRLTAHSPVEVTTSVTAVGDIIVLALENPASDGDDITVTATGSLRSTGGKVILRAGDDVSLANGSMVAALTAIEIRSGYADADTNGSTITMAGGVEAKLIDVRATAYADTIAVTTTATVKGTLVAVGLGGKDSITNSSDAAFTTAVGGIVFLVGDDADITLNPTTLVPTRVASKPGVGDDDVLENSGGFAVLVGGAGADRLVNGAGAAIVLGDEGAIDLAGAVVTSVASTSTAGGVDTIVAGAGTAVIIGGREADVITAGDGVNTIIGDEGRATFDTTGALTLAESINPSVGAADTFTLGKGAYRVIAGAGAETIALGPGTNYVIGDAGRITVGATETTMESIDPGTGADDTITLGAGTNAVIGGSGADTIRVLPGGTAGVGIVLGDNGSFTFTNATDKVKEIAGLVGDTNGAADTVELQNGVNIVITGRGKDSITAGGGTNTVLSDTGRATFAADGTVTLVETTESGTGDDDVITLQAGTNVVVAGAGSDAISLGGGTNYVLGDEGRLEVQGDGKTVVTTLNDAVGGMEKITVGPGFNVIAGGAKSDEITVNGTTVGAKAVVLGDDGTLTLSAAGVLLSVSNKDGVHASGAADTIKLTAGTNAVIGGAGGDTITATTGQNTILGDDGRAEFFDSGANVGGVKWIESMNSGLGGKDQVTLSAGTNTVIAGADDDTVTIGGGTNYVLGDEGRLEVQGDGKTVVTTLNDAVGGTEKITVGPGFNVIAGGAKSDEITVNGTTVGAKAVVLGDDGTLTLSAAGVLLSVSNKDGVHASGAADTIKLTAGTNAVIGGAGGDTITATTGQNTILGDDGRAEFFDSGANVGGVKWIESMNSGLGGKDRITLSAGTNTVIAGAEADTVSIGAGTAVVLGDEGRLEVTTDGAGAVAGRVVETLNDTVGGADTVTATGASSIVMGGAGGDTITGIQPTSGAPPVFLVLGDAGRAVFDATGLRVETKSPGTGGADVVRTVAAADIIFGGDAGDTISAGEGRNVVVGDNGTATFSAWPGGRLLSVESNDSGGGGGNDTITGGLADDLMIGGAGGDSINAGAGDNVVFGDGGRTTNNADGTPLTIASTDFTFGGADTITALAGNDLVIAGTGGDTVNAGEGTNIVVGDHATITLASGLIAGVTSIDTGSGGNDTITAGLGNDVVIGGFGADSVTSTGGRDVVVGDSGQATFAVNGEITLVTSLDDATGGADTVTTGGGADVTIGGAGADVVNAGAGGNIVLGDAGQVTWTQTRATRPTRFIYWAPTGVVNVAQTVTSAAGGADRITTGADDDVVLAGDSGDEVMSGDGRNFVVGDNGKVTFHAAPVGRPASVETTEPGTGGIDRVTTGAGDDLVLGGAAGDVIAAGAGDNAVVGDHGRVTYAAAGTFLSIETTDVTLGGADTITTMAGNDLAIGGTDGDTIDVGAGANVAFGDHAKITFAVAGQFAEARSIQTGSGGADTIRGGLGSDLVIAGFGGDSITSTGGRDVFVGDAGRATFALNGEITLVESIDQTIGGADTMSTAGGNSVMIGGAGLDTISAGLASIVFQDGGFVTWTPTRATRPGRLLFWALTGVLKDRRPL